MLIRIFIIYIFFFNFSLNGYASEKQSIINRLSEINNFSFNFEQVTKEKTETGNCTLEFDKKLRCSYDDKLQKEIIINNKTLVILQKKYDIEFPKRFSNDLYNYVSIPKEEYPVASKNFEQPIFDEKYFMNLHDKFRSPHLWIKNNDVWSLRHTAWKDSEKSNILETDQEKSAKAWQGNSN